MIFKIFRKKQNYNVKFFVFFSLISFVFFVTVSVLGILFLSLPKKEHKSTNRYFLREQNNKDPFIVNIPKFEDILKGPIITEDDPRIGSYDAPISIVYFSDFECDFCKRQEGVIKKIQEKYKDKVFFIWKDYPEGYWDSMSWKASVAGRCADEQGKFWVYHDLLYENSDNFSEDLFLELAKKLELREKDFSECLHDREIHELIRKNITEAKALNIKGVPFIYVNDRGFLGEMSEKELDSVIEAELKR